MREKNHKSHEVREGGWSLPNFFLNSLKSLCVLFLLAGSYKLCKCGHQKPGGVGEGKIPFEMVCGSSSVNVIHNWGTWFSSYVQKFTIFPSEYHVRVYFWPSKVIDKISIAEVKIVHSFKVLSNFRRKFLRGSSLIAQYWRLSNHHCGQFWSFDWNFWSLKFVEYVQDFQAQGQVFIGNHYYPEMFLLRFCHRMLWL